VLNLSKFQNNIEIPKTANMIKFLYIALSIRRMDFNMFEQICIVAIDSRHRNCQTMAQQFLVRPSLGKSIWWFCQCSDLLPESMITENVPEHSWTTHELPLITKSWHSSTKWSRVDQGGPQWFRVVQRIQEGTTDFLAFLLIIVY
jgi:hypothetical protein